VSTASTQVDQRKCLIPLFDYQLFSFNGDRTRCTVYNDQMQLYTINTDVTGTLNHIVLSVHWWSLRVPGRIDFVGMAHAQDRHFVKRFANDL
jgi:hypothetical protein